MNICLIASTPVPPQEGIGHYVWNLSRFLLRQGHTVQIITRGSWGRTQREEREGIIIWRPTFAPVYPWHVHLHSLFVNQLISRSLSDVDVFHAHSPLPPVIKTRRPILLTVHTPMRADARSIPLRNVQALLVRLQAPVSYRVEQQLLKGATRVAAVARSVASELAEYGLKPETVAVLGNGVDTTMFSPAEVEQTAAPYVLAAGRLGLRKGFEDLIECARIVTEQISDVRFLIAGSGPLEQSLRTQIEKAGLSGRVELLGHIADRQRMAALYRGAAVFVHPAHYEGLPTVLLEAMACGRPVVATAVSGALDVVEPEENGLLTPPKDPAALAGTVARLLADPALGQRLGRAARQTIEARYSWEKVGGRYLQIYRQLLGAG
ncbi:MAG: glycosyltransferase family 4 protein [Chloroflexi bacterium]|nr:glycosyltransferase family 4 protein [Chloroflexota bacterium]